MEVILALILARMIYPYIILENLPLNWYLKFIGKKKKKIHRLRKPSLWHQPHLMFRHLYLVRGDIQPCGFKYCRFTCNLHSLLCSRAIFLSTATGLPPPQAFLQQLKCNIPLKLFSHKTNKQTNLQSPLLDFSNSAFYPDSSEFDAFLPPGWIYIIRYKRSLYL